MISQATPQPATVGSQLTVYFTNGGNNGSVILKTLDGSKTWAIPYYTAGETAYNGFAYYDGSKVTFTVPSTIGEGELPENSGYQAPVPITSGTYNLTVYNMGCPQQSGTCTSSPETSAAFPITITGNSTAAPTTDSQSPLSAKCSGVGLRSASGINSVSWSSRAFGGSGTYAYSWELSDDVSSETNMADPNLTAQYVSSGEKDAYLTVTSGAQSATASCGATIAGAQSSTSSGTSGSQPSAPAQSSQPSATIKSATYATSEGSPESTQYNISFSVTNPGSQDIWVAKRLTQSASAMSGAVTWSTTKTTVAATTFEAATMSSSGSTSGDTSEGYRVPAGTTRTFTMSVTLAAAGSGYTGVRLTGIGYTAGSGTAGMTVDTDLSQFKTSDVYMTAGSGTNAPATGGNSTNTAPNQLTGQQIQAAISLLQSFSASSATIDAVQTVLNGGSMPAIPPASVDAPQAQSILALLQSWGASQSVIANTSAILNGSNAPTQTSDQSANVLNAVRNLLSVFGQN